MADVANKARRMIGLGPVDNQNINKIEKELGSRAEAEKQVVIDLLKESLEFDEDDIEALNILETKQAASMDIIYIAVENPNHIKEIYHRRAASGLDDLITREYIPPQYYERYKALANRASELRAQDKSLKTQIRWGQKYIEIFTKEKGSNEPLQKINLDEFMGYCPLPPFDNNRIWSNNKQSGFEKKTTVQNFT